MNINIIKLFLIAIVSIALISGCGATPKQKSSGKEKHQETGGDGVDDEDEIGREGRDGGEELLGDDPTPTEIPGPSAPSTPSPMGGDGQKQVGDFRDLNPDDNLFLGVIKFDDPYDGLVHQEINNGDKKSYAIKATFINRGSEVQMKISFVDGMPYPKTSNYTTSFIANYVGKDGKPKLKVKNLSVSFFDSESEGSSLEYRELQQKWKFTPAGELQGVVYHLEDGWFWDEAKLESFEIWIGNLAEDTKIKLPEFETLNDDAEKDAPLAGAQVTPKPNDNNTGVPAAPIK